MSYESPICVEAEKVVRDIIEKQDSYIVQETQRITGVNVDKDELIKALQYDRGQYEKGYMDGEIDTLKRNTWIPCKEKMPELFIKVLATDGDGMYVCDTVKVDDKLVWQDDYGYYHELDEFNAWMPLPLPYKEADK